MMIVALWTAAITSACGIGDTKPRNEFQNSVTILNDSDFEVTGRIEMGEGGALRGCADERLSQEFSVAPKTQGSPSVQMRCRDAPRDYDLQILFNGKFGRLLGSGHTVQCTNDGCTDEAGRSFLSER